MGEERWHDHRHGRGRNLDASEFCSRPDRRAAAMQGKVFSADALIDGFEQIKKEVAKEGLNRAYIPILQGISPGELQSAKNAKSFAEVLVRQWLAEYKFRKWEK